MKRLTILGVIACLGLLVGSAAVIGNPAGPPGGLDVNVVNPVPLPVTGNVNVSTVYRFAEFSTTTTDGDGHGIGGMYNICQTDLGDPNARMCTTEEFLMSPSISQIPLPSSPDSVYAWIQPKPGAAIEVFDDAIFVFDAVGIIIGLNALTSAPYAGEATCNQWRNDGGGRGMTVEIKHDGMRFLNRGCDNNQLIACCAPAS